VTRTVPETPRLLLVDLDSDLVDAWRLALEAEIATGAIDVRCGSLLDVLPEVDAVITAGNSYGQMDGGVDRVLSERWPKVQKAVWGAIADEHDGYLPVGSACVVPTGDAPCGRLVYAPTMRVPMPLAGGLEMAVHDAFWAALVAVRRQPGVQVVAAPGFGTGYGRVSPRRAAQLMAAAITMWRLPATTQFSRREGLLRPLS
jgi:O-acetyl-ADP-ribose deacetylase (regulator of RNase III)